MTLEQLKALMDEALAAAAAKPEDAELKVKADAATQAFNDAKAKAEANSEDSDQVDESKLDDKTKAYLAKLRKENADRRTKNKDLASKLAGETARTKAILKAAGIEDESEKPEEQVKALSAQTQQLAFRNAILESAVEHGIVGDDIEYFEFLVAKAAGDLKEGEELSDDQLKAIVAKCRKSGKGANTSINGGNGGSGSNPPPKPGSAGQVTLDQFCRMTITEKDKLYRENQALYTQLISEARAKKKLV